MGHDKAFWPNFNWLILNLETKVAHGGVFQWSYIRLHFDCHKFSIRFMLADKGGVCNSLHILKIKHSLLFMIMCFELLSILGPVSYLLYTFMQVAAQCWLYIPSPFIFLSKTNRFPTPRYEIHFHTIIWTPPSFTVMEAFWVFCYPLYHHQMLFQPSSPNKLNLLSS